MNDQITVYLPFAKKDSDKRIVEGFASTEAVDSQGEIVKADAIAKALPDYMKYANIREMHQWSAVGKTVSAEMREKEDDSKGLYIQAKVVDEGAWQKCKEGVYNGFSIGGQVVKRVGNVIQDLILNEISLVDRPANPEAVFALVKRDNGKLVKCEDCVDGPMEEPAHMAVYAARELLAICTDMCYMYEMYEMQGKDTSDLDKAIKIIQGLAAKTLMDDGDKKKMADLFNDLTKKTMFGKSAEQRYWAELKKALG